MSGSFLLDWISLSISLSITMLLFWLALVVWLNSEHRTWGIHLTSGGLLLGALFFVAHSILLAQAYNFTNPWMDVWWQIGWVPVILSPFAWYLVVLWYTGYWESRDSALHRRHCPFLYLASFFTLLLIGLLIFGHPLPTYAESLRLDFNQVPLTILGIPVLIAALPANILFCLALAIDALLRPGPTRRPFADTARSRARPWLLASSLLLVIVSLLVGWVLMQILAYSRQSLSYGDLARLSLTLARYDLLIAAVTGLSILGLGQALVSYEIFTGKALPRQGLRRYYYSAVLLFGGISLFVAAAYILRISAIYSLLLALLVMTGYFAMLTWRSFRERDWAVRQLRPFVASQRLYDQIVRQPAQHTTPFEANDPFFALCRDVLDTRRAALTAAGSLASLIPNPLTYPPDEPQLLPNIELVCPQCTTPDRMAVQLNRDQSYGFTWAIPLWSERGLIGVLLLGDKNSRGFYTQEEIEIARASGERLLDTLASVEIIRRMTDLQREQMVSAQVIDRRTRRSLHDEILPALHTQIIKLSAASNSKKVVVEELSGIHRQISALLRELPAPFSPDLQSMGLLAALQHLVRVDLVGLFDKTEYIQAESADAAASALPTLTADVLYYASREAVRNAAQHARSDQPLHLRMIVSGDLGFQITIEDNGVGILSSVPCESGSSGQGLMLHSTLMAVIGGSLSIESKPSEYTRIILSLL
jgi:signal transduction histidine kinase